MVLQFLVDPSVEVRKQATLTCCEVLAKHGKQILQRGATGRVSNLSSVVVSSPNRLVTVVCRLYLVSLMIVNWSIGYAAKNFKRLQLGSV